MTPLGFFKKVSRLLNFISLIFRFILKLVFGLSAAIIAVGLLLITLTVVVLSLLTSLVTGRKSTPSRVFARFQQFSQRRTWPGNRTFSDKRKAGLNQIVDVEAHEIKDAKREP